jgi:hypothetical protein
VAVTQLTYSGTTTDSAPSSPAKLLRDLGTFTKLQAGTKIFVNWDSHGSGSALTFAVCNLSIRVDNAAAFTGDLGAVYKADSAYYPISLMRVFSGLGVGTHTVSIYSRGVSATTCSENDGNYPKGVVIQEIN